MILYVNGDSHAAGAEAANTFAFAEDDPNYRHLGRRPHPDNLAVSWGQQLANQLGAELVCDAESGSSNRRIIRTTLEFIRQRRGYFRDTLIIIGWSTWERSEILDDDGQYWQIGASGLDYLPTHLHDRYRNFIGTINWRRSMNKAYAEVITMHNWLKSRGISHLFFNCNSHFRNIDDRTANWGACYLDPYNPDRTMDRILRKHKFETVNPNSWHFGKDAHCFWADYVLHYLNSNNLLPK
jgi:hypothetical protein